MSYSDSGRPNPSADDHLLADLLAQLRLRFAEKAVAQSRQIAAIASVHRLLRSPVPPKHDPNQMPLF